MIWTHSRLAHCEDAVRRVCSSLRTALVRNYCAIHSEADIVLVACQELQSISVSDSDSLGVHPDGFGLCRMHEGKVFVAMA